MKKLTAEVARRDIGHLKSFQSDPKVGLSLKEEKYLQALEIALPVLEQQDGWVSCSDRMPEKLIPVIVHHQDGEMWSSMWNGGFWDDGTDSSEPYPITHWRFMPNPPQSQTDTYQQIDNDGWLHWNGEMALPPVKSHVLVEVKRRNGGLIQRQAQEFAWRNSPVKSGIDIIAYRVIENDGREG